MPNVYENCPDLQSQHFLLRQTTLADAADLLRVYSDPKAWPLFNSDNCGGDDFHYTDLAKMQAVIDYWGEEYQQQGFVRWSVVHSLTKTSVGTVELFGRHAADFFDDTAILRLDLRSDFEREDVINEIIATYLPYLKVLFKTSKVATKAIPAAKSRRQALGQQGFQPTAEVLLGHDGTAYSDYYVRALK
ncbi:MAG: GNAT family N-acetyltransferase [Lactobacillus sp.]|jgi:RimJ/RimL family protein N-acetyltransferase|nr:GNAT family N-acetyltransferase [Lactobacillus sp.]